MTPTLASTVCSPLSIRGDGIAARCCERLLHQAGITTTTDRGSRPQVPAILLGDPALALIRDVFGNDHLFRNSPKIKQRVVQWQRDLPPVKLPHSGVVVSERELLEALITEPVRDPPINIQGTLYAARPLPEGVQHHSFGTRAAAGVRVSFRPNAPPETCWIESLPKGWLFLLPGWLLAVGGTPTDLLAESQSIASQIDTLHETGATFQAYPRIASPLCAEEWIACGTAAMAFDPLCGDGTAHAVREGILAAAVLRSQECRKDLSQHYDARLIAGFHRHLALCREFYRTGFGGPWWDHERDLTEQGLAWCAAKLQSHGPFRYRLNGYRLEPLLP